MTEYSIQLEDHHEKACDILRTESDYENMETADIVQSLVTKMLDARIRNSYEKQQRGVTVEEMANQITL